MGKLAGVNLKKATIEGLKPKAAMYRVPDAEVRGLNIQVTPAGVLSWVLRFRVHGHQKAHTLGRWPELTVAQARKKALSLLGDIGDGNDPAAKKKEERKAKTIKDLADQFRKEHLPALKENSRIQYERLLGKRILPALGSKRIKDVDSSDVAALLSQIRLETPKGIEANRVRAVLSKMFSMGALWGFCPAGTNPAKGQARAPEVKKDRHMSDRELLALGETMRHLEPTPAGEERPVDALPSEDCHALAAFRLYLLTGMRKSELIGDRKRDKETRAIIEKVPALPWTAVDLDAARIRLEYHKTAKKAGVRIVQLSTAACNLLEALPKVLGNPYVIPGHDAGESLVGLQKIWERVRDAVGTLQEKAKVPKKSRVDVSDVTIHDLRRSFASLAARMGYPELIVAALLGHSAGSVTAGYARIGADPLRDVVETIGARMAALLAGSVDLEAEAKAAKEEAQAKRTAKGA
ncbi:tyrosine-type recombinase/integrase [Geothrix edaphica]|uniref:Integrase n=1 Tax=Geothrix edaphica TaxID=2927976 RepID=A0ABQ5PY66_9BACT|nr:site-specific integrase [Geothrix edaphica]GLH67308.1 integrase [Geothrix edaphica]